VRGERAGGESLVEKGDRKSAGGTNREYRK